MKGEKMRFLELVDMTAYGHGVVARIKLGDRFIMEVKPLNVIPIKEEKEEVVERPKPKKKRIEELADEDDEEQDTEEDYEDEDDEEEDLPKRKSARDFLK